MSQTTSDASSGWIRRDHRAEPDGTDGPEPCGDRWHAGAGQRENVSTPLAREQGPDLRLPTAPPADAAGAAPADPVAPTLRMALEQALARRSGVTRRIVELRRRPSDYRSSCPLEEIDLRLEDGAELRLMFKSLGGNGVPGRAPRVKPAFLRMPRREIEVYQNVLDDREARAGLGTPACHGSVVDPAADRYWLFLERVPGLPLYQVGIEKWLGAARWLARFHARFQSPPRIERLGNAAPFVRYDAPFYRLWMDRALSSLCRSPYAGPSHRAAVARLGAVHPAVVRHLGSLPPTLIHGAFFGPKVLVGRDPGDSRVCPVDWETAGLGPGYMDLAALVAGKWTDAQRKQLTMAYYGVHCAALDTAAPPPAEFSRALLFCRLHVAIQWLGWSPDWTPPESHEQDWLGEAGAVADALGL